MNKSELIEALAPRLGGRSQAAAAVETLVDVVLREVAAGRSVGITGFGTFERVERAPRTGRNPRTGEPVPIARTCTPRFRPGAYFKDVVADPSAMPSDGLAGARVGSEAGAERTGAPSSVRRTTTRAETGGRDRDRGRAKAGRDESRGSRGRGGSGTPDTVRRTDQSTAAAASPGPGTATAPVAGRVMTGGEEITQSMISAKKAQLARVQNDELAARREKQAKKSATSGKGKKSDQGKGRKKGSGSKKDKKSGKK